MSDADTPAVDPDQPAEAFDEDVLDGEFPPDRPIGLDDADPDDAELPDTLVERDVDEDDADDDWILPDSEHPGPLADDDEFTGDETTRDVATERVPRPAEEAALHLDDTDTVD